MYIRTILSIICSYVQPFFFRFPLLCILFPFFTSYTFFLFLQHIFLFPFTASKQLYPYHEPFPFYFPSSFYPKGLILSTQITSLRYNLFPIIFPYLCHRDDVQAIRVLSLSNSLDHWDCRWSFGNCMTFLRDCCLTEYLAITVCLSSESRQ